jgi:hypothetical protein
MSSSSDNKSDDKVSTVYLHQLNNAAETYKKSPQLEKVSYNPGQKLDIHSYDNFLYPKVFTKYPNMMTEIYTKHFNVKEDPNRFRTPTHPFNSDKAVNEENKIVSVSQYVGEFNPEEIFLTESPTILSLSRISEISGHVIIIIPYFDNLTRVPVVEIYDPNGSDFTRNKRGDIDIASFFEPYKTHYTNHTRQLQQIQDYLISNRYNIIAKDIHAAEYYGGGFRGSLNDSGMCTVKVIYRYLFSNLRLDTFLETMDEITQTVFDYRLQPFTTDHEVYDYHLESFKNLLMINTLHVIYDGILSSEDYDEYGHKLPSIYGERFQVLIEQIKRIKQIHLAPLEDQPGIYSPEFDELEKNLKSEITTLAHFTNLINEIKLAEFAGIDNVSINNRNILMSYGFTQDDIDLAVENLYESGRDIQNKAIKNKYKSIAEFPIFLGNQMKSQIETLIQRHGKQVQLTLRQIEKLAGSKDNFISADTLKQYFNNTNPELSISVKTSNNGDLIVKYDGDPNKRYNIDLSELYKIHTQKTLPEFIKEYIKESGFPVMIEDHLEKVNKEYKKIEKNKEKISKNMRSKIQKAYNEEQGDIPMAEPLEYLQKPRVKNQLPPANVVNQRLPANKSNLTIRNIQPTTTE